MTLTCRLLKSVELDSKRRPLSSFPPDGQFQPDSKLTLSHTLAVNDLSSRPHTLIWRDNQHLLPRPPFPLNKDASAAGTHVFCDRPFFKPWFIVETNFQDHRFRDSFFHSASRHRHCHIHLPGQRFSHCTPLAGVFNAGSSQSW